MRLPTHRETELRKASEILADARARSLWQWRAVDKVVCARDAAATARREAHVAKEHAASAGVVFKPRRLARRSAPLVAAPAAEGPGTAHHAPAAAPGGGPHALGPAHLGFSGAFWGEQAIVDLFTSIGVGAFRFSAALVPWTERELERLEAMWVQAYEWAWGLPWTTASEVYTLPNVVAGMEYPRPIGIMTQELCSYFHRCLKHEDVARKLTLRDLKLACEQWTCGSLRELREKMGLWKWDLTLCNRWARVAKCMQLLNIPGEFAEDANEDKEQRETSWARRVGQAQRASSGAWGNGSKRLEGVKTSGRLGCGVWTKSSGIYYGLVSRPPGRRGHGFLERGTAR
jgi:hypothetical protein